jgi:dCMP deaminase
MRPEHHSYFFAQALVASSRSTCRVATGAVLVAERELITTSYNGAPKGKPHCSEVGCWMQEVRGRERCVRTVHAELNCLLKAEGGDAMYCTHQPCLSCLLALEQRRPEILQVHYIFPYDDIGRDEYVAQGISLKLMRHWDDQLFRELYHIGELFKPKPWEVANEGL